MKRTLITTSVVVSVIGGMSQCIAADETNEPAPAAKEAPASEVKLEAKEAPSPWEKASVSFGGFVSAFDSTVAFGVNNIGVTINAEDLLNLDSTLTVFRVNALWRPGESRRNQFDFTYAAYHRDGHAVLDRESDIDDVVFPVGADVNTVFNFDIIRGTYSYALLQDDRMRIALGLGVYAVPVKFSIDGETTGGRANVEAADTVLPLPALALRGDFLLVRKLYLMTSIDAMYLEIGDFKGSLLDVNVALEYRPWNHVGFGVGYNSFSTDIEAKDSGGKFPGTDFIGKVNISYSGLMLYGKLLF